MGDFRGASGLLFQFESGRQGVKLDIGIGSQPETPKVSEL